ncbi:hypothetical protein THIAE_04445 [Thiomicrospira aerophila AL3]|uniref:Polysaccharide chain length determinant N-terminal domain-containing protein n=1 Tax=Thiomicrospira aerophila AL3 TaxID=717772 RepID=W0DUX9_9GAMM|nr:Wzz/FepE/Etk N-terminal domain-containing protein [Thiomicrospira aerophila]AHF02237.1 hypothetical protein THIAE_04445 [Thiomicrospira aerophila AL3]
MQQNHSELAVSPRQYDDEIDLFELFETLWAQKWLIAAVTALTGVFAFLFVLFAPSKADSYQGEVLLEVATVQMLSGQSAEVVTVEELADLHAIIPKIAGVSSSVNRGDSKVVTLSFGHHSKENVESRLIGAVEIIQARHELLLSRMQNIALIQPTTQVGEISLALVSPKQNRLDKLNLILAVGLVLGLMLGVFIALIRSAIQKRRAKLNESSPSVS